MSKSVVGFIEPVTIHTKKKKIHVDARIDTGATKSSIDLKLAEKIGVGPVVAERVVKNTHGKATRKVVELEITLAEKTMKTKFTIADRSHMKFPVLIGRSALRRGFIIDPKKRH